MSYKWEEFNIKTFPAETIVYRDGAYCAELSTLPDITTIDTRYDLPVHFIYVGEIAGENRIAITVTAENQPVFLTVKIENKKPAFFNIFVKNAGKNSKIKGYVVLKNNSELNADINAEHIAKNTDILIKTKIIAGKNTSSSITGAAIIGRDTENCESDLGFVALADADAKIKFAPSQYIATPPKSAEHGAAIYHPGTPQIEYLKRGGMTAADAEQILRDAFLNDMPDYFQ